MNVIRNYSQNGEDIIDIYYRYVWLLLSNELESGKYETIV